MFTLAIIAATVLVSWRAFNDQRLLGRLILWPPAVTRNRQYDRLLGYGFIHADWAHLLFNMITLWSFGMQVERVFSEWISPVGYLLFYLSAIVVSILPTYIAHRNDPNYRSLGASGGVSAVLFASILFDPWSTIFIISVSRQPKRFPVACTSAPTGLPAMRPISIRALPRASSGVSRTAATARRRISTGWRTKPRGNAGLARS